jgi:peptidoglycan/xylan/chitin deacetylase (PgdA/CDA1 family)
MSSAYLYKWIVRSSLNFSRLDKVLFDSYLGMGCILMLHRVVEEENGRSKIIQNKVLEITAKNLEWLITFFLAMDYEIISLDEVVERLKGGRRSRRKFVSFTFDDGYADNFHVAYPIFRTYNAPFTIYVATSFPEGRAPLWWYPLETLLCEREEVAFTHEGNSHRFPTRTVLEKQEAFKAIRRLVLSCDPALYVGFLTSLFGECGIDLFSEGPKLMLKWEEIKALSEDGLVTIGAHTVNHYALNRLSEEEAQFEIEESRKILEAHTGRKVEHFSYPYGTYLEVGRREFELVRKTGFKTATTCRLAHIFPEHLRHLECLPRIEICGAAQVFNHLPYMDGLSVARLNRWRKVITD